MSSADLIERELSAFTSACYEQERAAQRYSEAVIASEREDFRDFCREQDPDDDLTDLVHEYVDTLQTVIYTHRARALVIGWGEDDAREEYRREFGGDAPSYEVLAYQILHAELYPIAAELEEDRIEA